MRRALQERLRWAVVHAESGNGFLWVCAVLAFLGTVTIAYPVTAIVVPAALIAPRRWIQITPATAFGSSVGAALLMLIVHSLGWGLVLSLFPETPSHGLWSSLVSWMEQHGLVALFFVAASPLPQTPALIFFSMADYNYFLVFLVLMAGKLLKYGAAAWLASRFPDLFENMHAGR